MDGANAAGAATAERLSLASTHTAMARARHAAIVLRVPASCRADAALPCAACTFPSAIATRPLCSRM
ncbi:hypothetical protein CEK66_11665 [Xanthomonas sp. LMG 12460]|nr:hypothetical protein CEK66_11665 [Xanthomonas sp. LMG 12460]